MEGVGQRNGCRFLNVAYWVENDIVLSGREEIIPMQRRDFIKSTAAVAVAAELGMGKVQAKVPATTGETTTSAPSPRDRSPQSGSVPSIPT